MSEYATMKVPLARSKRPLEFFVDGTFNKQYWEDTARQLGPAAHVGEIVQITKVTFQGDRLLFDINYGLTSGRRWYDGVQVGANGPVATSSTTTQVDNPNGSATPTLGTYIVVVFRTPMEGLTSKDVKAALSRPRANHGL
jgi:hypothetical protein